MLDYSHYRPDSRTLVKIIVTGVIIGVMAGWMFFDSLKGILLTLVYLPLYVKIQLTQKHKARSDKLRLEFRDAINSLSAALEAGYSIENAVKETITELELIYDPDAMIITEFKEIVRKLNNNINIETALWDFAIRSHIDDIIYFAEVFSTAKRSGGNILHIIRVTRSNICDKIELNRELDALIASKLYEVKVMKIVPLGIILYLKIFNYEMLAPLYTKISGNIIMTVVLIGYFGLCRLADKITDIKL